MMQMIIRTQRNFEAAYKMETGLRQLEVKGARDKCTGRGEAIKGAGIRLCLQSK